MPLMLNGKTLQAPKQKPPSQKYSTSLGFLAFDAVTWAQERRSCALRAWNRIERLQVKVNAKPHHRDVQAARDRISELTNEFLNAQVEFLKWEESLVSLWKEATAEERETEDIAELLHTHPVSTVLYPMWHKPLGSQEGAPAECRMNTTALQFVSAATIRRYQTSGIHS